jgi:hypothetical protein
VGYLAAGGAMAPITAETYTTKLMPEGATVGKRLLENAKFLGTNWKRESIATTMFGALWASTDFFGEAYDKFFHKLQKPENAVPLNDNQQAHHAELLAKLNEKFPVHGQGRAA